MSIIKKLFAKKKFLEDGAGLTLAIVLVIALATLAWSWRYFLAAFLLTVIYEAGYWTYRFVQWRREMKAQLSVPAPIRVLPPPPRTREEILQAMEKEYQEELKVVSGLPLDDEERAVALETAKKRYLEKIEGMMS